MKRGGGVMRQLWFGLAIWMVVLVNAPVLKGQYKYPAESQLKKDGTAILLEDFANLPLSSPTNGGVTGVTSAAINFRAQLGRANYLRSEPANAPRAASRSFVVDQSSTLYILDN